MRKQVLTLCVLIVISAACYIFVVRAGNPPLGTSSSVVLRRLYGSEVSTLNYLRSASTTDLKAAVNTIDCLVEYDCYGIVRPALAVSWEHNADCTAWTFKIRPGVKWVDKDGEEVADVTAHDWVCAADYVNNAHNGSFSQYTYNGIVRNAAAYHRQTSMVLDAKDAVKMKRVASVEAYFKANGIDTSSFISSADLGVRAIDDYTLEYTTEAPCPYFISVLSYASYMPVYGPFLEECGESFGTDNEKLLYNGAYILKTYEPRSRRVLTANNSYWDRENVFINTVEYIYNARSVSLAPAMFARGEIDYAEIDADLLDEWLNNEETSDSVHPSPVDRSYSYFYLFNFEPRFDKRYEPDNWTRAVNNENFRKSLMAGLDRIRAISVTDPYNPGSLINNTITPALFAAADGKDYTDFKPITAIARGDSFNEEKALGYKKAAMAELKAAGATFPVKILIPYNPAVANWGKECGIIEQQLQTLLGSDYIDIIVEAGPSTGFLSQVRRGGRYALTKCNWDAGYADPQTWTTPFRSGNNYNFMFTDARKFLGDKPMNSKSERTRALVDEYYRLVEAASDQTGDEAARYSAFAKAEAFFIEHAFAIPFSVDTSGYVAERLDPFDAQFASFGLAKFRFKGRRLLEKSMSMEQFQAAYEKWQLEREQAVAAAKR